MTVASPATVNRTPDKPPPSEGPPSSPPESSPNEPTSAEGAGPKGGESNWKEDTKPQEAARPITQSSGQDSERTQGAFDDFGLPIRARTRPAQYPSDSGDGANSGLETRDKEVPPHNDCPADEQVNGSGALEGRPQAQTPTTRSGVGEQTAHQEKDILPEYQEPLAASTTEVQAMAAEPNQPRTSRSTPRDSHISEWSHQRLAQPHEHTHESEEEDDEPEDWNEMPAYGEFDYYDDYGRLIVRGANAEDNDAVYRGLGGAGNGYTRVQLDEDAQSATSLDEDTSYLFREPGDNSAGVEGEELRDSISQLQATKDFLNETQKIAYVGVVRVAIHQMSLEMQKVPTTKGTRKTIQKAADGMRKWGQAIMGRIYVHMDIDSAEQVMIEQLAEHGVQPADLVRPLMQNARVKNPLAEQGSPSKSPSSAASPGAQGDISKISSETAQSSDIGSPPPYEAHEGEELPEVRTPSQMPTSDRIDIDLRWTVLCDLFLVLIADSAYDARSRSLLERVGAAMDVSWLQIARFEKRVTDALEMQEQTDKENWDESDHMEKRRKMALSRKYMIMGLATVGGGLVIGLSAGLLAPVIGAGLAAGFTTVGISGTGAFLGGTGGTALIASGATLTGTSIGLKAANRRTGAVRTFEYRPLHNNKKLSLIVTVSGWMIGKADDVRLPFSTVDPIMGDIYSVLWEPEMLRSMGDTINILATEALTQGLQHVLGSTILMALMASIQLPLALSKLAYLIDNPWNVSLDRANSAGLIMADSLRDRNLGSRPITLLGFSLGTRVIFSCLKELADKGAHGLIQNVYLFGSPIVANKDDYLKARSVVSGRFVNGFSKNDWILGYLFRATSGGIMRVAGLSAVEGIPGLENFDVTELVNGHMEYRTAMPRLLRKVGWEVLDDEFAEIEDPDPDNHTERQRELIREIDEARRESELKPEKKRFGLFKRGKMAEKRVWETYDVDRNSAPRWSSEVNSSPGTVLFDIDAIRAELASEAIEVKQLESTLPPMKLELNPPSNPSPTISSPQSNTSPVVSRTASEPQLHTGPGPSLPDRSNASSTPPKEEEIQMTFDTSFHEPPPYSQSIEPSDPPTRPGLRPSATMPANIGVSALGAMDMEPNAWADHDMGHSEGGIQMTFE